MRNLFKHKKLEEKIEPDNLKEGLVYAIYAISHNKESSIFLYIDGQNDILLGNRWHPVTSLCAHNNWLYDGGHNLNEHELLGFVIDTITGKDIMERKDNKVYSLCSHNRNLYRGDYGGIFEVLTGKKIAGRIGSVTAICSHEGVLYDCGGLCDYNTIWDGVYETFKPRIISQKYPTRILCSHEKTLCGIGWDQHTEPFGMWCLFNVLKNKKILEISEKGYVKAMCSYKGRLHYGTYTGIYDAFGNKTLLRDKGPVTAMCSIPAELVEQIKHSHNNGFNFGDVQHINPKGFIEYLSINTKKEREKIISQLFNCENINKEVLDWLNKNEQDTMREVSFSG